MTIKKQEISMKNGYKILWTDHALQELSATISHLQLKWTERELSKFATTLDHTVEIISRHPKIYPVYSKKKKIRRAVVDKNNTIYYRIVKNTVEILSVFAAKRSPINF